MVFSLINLQASENNIWNIIRDVIFSFENPPMSRILWEHHYSYRRSRYESTTAYNSLRNYYKPTSPSLLTVPKALPLSPKNVITRKEQNGRIIPPERQKQPKKQDENWSEKRVSYCYKLLNGLNPRKFRRIYLPKEDEGRSS